MISNGTVPKDTKILIQNVKSFHELRATMCNAMKKMLKNNQFIDCIIKGRIIEQINGVPSNSKCCITKETLRNNSGILLVIDENKPYTVHSRLKSTIYNFWVLAHYPEEIGVQARRWLSKQDWYTRGNVVSLNKAIERFTQFQDQLFSKKAYIKLKAINDSLHSVSTSA